MKRVALSLLLSLPACGLTGPSPDYSGEYSGPMLYNVQGTRELSVTGRTTVIHSGNRIRFEPLTIRAAHPFGIPLGSGRLSGDTATSTSNFGVFCDPPPGVTAPAEPAAWPAHCNCGTTEVETKSRFSGRSMNLEVTLTSPRCAASRFVGELSR